MKSLYLSLSLLLCGILFGAASGCVVDFPDELPYSCETNEDCGGKGYLCTALPDARKYCCLPEAEQCNRLDDDCDGTVDELDAESCYTGPEETRGKGACRPGKPSCGNGNLICTGQVLPSAELCNGIDDDCDGATDEDFDFQTGRNNCGRCDQVCTALQDCLSGECVKKRETACDNSLDDDADGQSDCVDTDCTSLPCGAGCVCLAGKKAESDCANGVDDEVDGRTDCGDSDCDTKVCGAGCICLNNAKGEGDCANGVDDEGDGQTDCGDSNCTEKACGLGCVCRGGAKVEDLCDDNLDNDGDGAAKTDCQDNDCAGRECGLGCLCEGLAKKEVACADNLDNNGDSRADCADPQCNNQACVAGETGASCRSNQCAELRCGDTQDNDRDGKTDCSDTDCNGVQCPKQGGGNGTCQNGACV